MVQDFYPNLSTTQLGYRAGFLGSSYSFGGLFGNLIWGVVSDKYGRRPALLSGVMGTAVLAACFGFSPTFVIACIFRFVWGFVNGNVGVAKTYMAEILDDSNQAKGMAYWGVIGGIGRVLGPIIGSTLSSPAELYPSTFGPHSIFVDYPFAMPCLFVSFCSVLAFVLGYFELDETLVVISASDVRRDTAYSPLTTDESVHSVHSSHSSSHSLDYSNDKDERGQQRDFAAFTPEQSDAPHMKKSLSFSSVVTVKVIDSSRLAYSPLNKILPDDVVLDPTDDERFPSSKEDLGLDNDSSMIHNLDEYKVQPTGHNMHLSAVRFSNGSEFNELLEQRTFFQTIWYLLRKKEVLVSTCMYGINAFVSTVAAEVFPLWVVTSLADGGLGFSISKIGTSAMVTGAVSILANILIYPGVVARLGIVKTYKLSMYVFAIGCTLLPSISAITAGWTWRFGSLVVVTLVQSCTSSASLWAMLCIFVMINNCTYSQNRATANSIGQTFASLGRLMGPYLGSLAFAWSDNNEFSWPLNQYFVWYLIAIAALMSTNLPKRLPRSIERRKREPKRKVYTAYDDDSQNDTSTGTSPGRRSVAATPESHRPAAARRGSRNGGILVYSPIIEMTNKRYEETDNGAGTGILFAGSKSSKNIQSTSASTSISSAIGGIEGNQIAVGGGEGAANNVPANIIADRV